VQEAALAVALKALASHDWHVRSEVAVASARTRVPGGQTLTEAQAVAGMPSLSHVPSPQVVAGLVPPAQYWPATQGSHAVALAEVPAAVWIVPAAQLPWGRQLDWFAPLEYCSLGQAVHTRSAVDEGVLLTKVPAWQVDQGAQATALETVLNAPLAHAAQTRSLVAVPSSPTRVPGRHEVFATHGVAELRSWSQVSAAQPSASASPPGQYCPAAHELQTAAEVEVPEATWIVPAGQVPWGWHEVWLLLAEYWPAGQPSHVRSTVVDGVPVT
jgi:hypothetical protein